MLKKGVNLRFRPVSIGHLRDRGVRWLVGPGLFFALAFLAGAPRAEIPVGLDARGVDPMAAVDNFLGLDVRDTFGRPVSGVVVLAELKRAQVARVAEIAYASALPQARLMLPILEYSVGSIAWLMRLAPPLSNPTTWSSLPTPRPKVCALLLLALAAALTQAAAVLRPRVQRASLSSFQGCPEVLRC